MSDWVSLLVFAATSFLVLLVFLLLNRDGLRATARARRLGGALSGQPSPGWAQRALARLPLVGRAVLAAHDLDQARRLRFARAGIYSPQAPAVFRAARWLLAGLGLGAGLAVALSLALAPPRALLACVVLPGVGLIVPGLWLDARAARWQASLRRGLPDAIDMLVLCLEGGVSLTAAFQHVTADLRLAHPDLGGELELVQQEMLLGHTAGEAIQKFGNRCGLEEVRSLAAVLVQNERFGVSVARALRIHADAMRQQRQQRAEEMAQKAAVKILFPTLLCIFPAIFIVVLGPAAYRILAIFSQMR
jgi:tight adherence protein C